MIGRNCSITIALSLGLVLCPASSQAQDVTAPTINAPNRVAECRGDTSPAFINPVVADDVDPLPSVSFSVGGTPISDPGNYPQGNTTVQIQACDSSGNCALANSVVSVLDTTNPAVNAGTDRTATCNAAAMGMDGTVVMLATPNVVDECDGMPFLSSDAPALFPIGQTTVTVTAIDSSGNLGTDSLLVSVQDDADPVVGAVQSFEMESRNECDPLGGSSNTGSWIRIPRPTASDTCSTADNLAFALSNETAARIEPFDVVCLDADTDFHWLVYDEAGRVTQSATFTVAFPGAPAFTFTTAGASGFTNGDVNVTTSTVSGATFSVLSQPAPTTIAQSTNALNATFTEEGTYCRLLVRAVDGGNESVNDDLCFAIDRRLPSFTFDEIPADSTFFFGDTINGQVLAQDNTGTVQSGVEGIVLTLDPNVNCAPGDGTDEATCEAIVGCSWINASSSCTQLFSPIELNNQANTCSNVNVFGLSACPANDIAFGCTSGGSECGADGRIQIGSLPPGNHVLRVAVTDAAGNTSSGDYPFFVAGLEGTIATSITAIDDLIADFATPLAAIGDLSEARDLLTTAELLLSESPGHAFLLGRRAWTLLDQARGAGADTAEILDRIARIIVGEIRNLVALTADRSLTNWSLLSIQPGEFGGYEEAYRERVFANGGGDFLVNVQSTLNLAQARLDTAEDEIDMGLTLSGISSAIEAFNGMALLFEDDVYASRFGRAVNTLSGGEVEAYYRRSIPSSFGDFTAQTVAAQIDRLGAFVNDLPADSRDKLTATRALLADFSVGVAPIQDWNFGPQYNNEDLTRQVYLNAQEALEELRTIQGSSVYTYNLQAGLALTLGFVINFSMYEGDAALTRTEADIAAGMPGEYTATGSGEKMYMDDGSAAMNGLDNELQLAECRYNQLMRDLSQGRVDDAVDLFLDSKCIIIELYNRYYGENPVLQAAVGDAPIDPIEYDCMDIPLNTVTMMEVDAACPNPAACAADDTTCDGVDDDCDGVADEDYVAVACGQGVCSGTSQCVNGVEVACEPGAPQTTLDVTCDGLDNDCDGLVDDDFITVSCGIGQCNDTSLCCTAVASPDVANCMAAGCIFDAGDMRCEANAGGALERACTPDFGKASTEICDGIDNNCNLLADENLDNDRDGFGCAPQAAPFNNPDTNCLTPLPSLDPAAICRADGEYNTCCTGSDANGRFTACDDNCFDVTNMYSWDCDDSNPNAFPGNPEVCDGADNNCNGMVDEGVLNACGNCDPNCTTTTYGKGGIPFNPTPDNSDSVVDDGTGGLTLNDDATVEVVFAWIANDQAGTMSKIDTTSGKEVARYCVALVSATDENGDSRGVANVCAACGGCNRASRTAVNLDNNVFLANRAHASGGTQSTITKVFNLSDDCVDYDGDGTVQTSVDANDNSIIDLDADGNGTQDWQELSRTVLPSGDANFLDPTTVEYWGEEDECIAWTKKPTEWKEDPAGCDQETVQMDCEAIDGCLWDMGTNTCSLSCAAGENTDNSGGCNGVLGCVWRSNVCLDLGEGTFNARALAVDADNDVWLGNYRERGFFEMDGRTGEVKRFIRMDIQPYGAVIDSRGLLWAPDGCCGSGRIRAFNVGPAAVDIGTGPTTIDVMPAGTVFTANNDTYLTDKFRMSGTRFNYGIAVDGLNRVWLGSYNDRWVGARYDPADNTWVQIPAIALNPTGTPLDPATTPGSAMTVSAWINSEDLSGRIVDKGGGFGQAGYAMSWFQGQLLVELQRTEDPPEAVQVLNSTMLSEDTWYHVGFTYDDTTDEIITYVNGVQENHGAVYTGPVGVAFPALSTGRSELNGDYFDGIIDDVRISDSVRDADWFAAEYDAARDAMLSYGAPEVFASQGDWGPGSAYNKRIRLDIDNTTRGQLDNFPVLVKLDPMLVDYADFGTLGEDILFTDSDGATQLDYEREFWAIPIAPPFEFEAEDFDSATSVNGTHDWTLVAGAPFIEIEAEDFDSTTSVNGTHDWSVETTEAGFNGTGYIQSLPNDGTNCTGGNFANCSVAEYTVNIPTAGDYSLSVRSNADNGSDNSIHWGFDGSVVHQDWNMDSSGEWVWNNSDRTVTLTAGNHTLQIWQREDGYRLDTIRVGNENSGFEGTGYIEALPDDGTSCTGGNFANCALVEWNVNIPVDGDYYVSARMRATNGNEDSIHWGFDGSVVHRDWGFGSNSGWVWRDSDRVATLSAGMHTFQVWMREDGTRIDKFRISTTLAGASPSTDDDKSYLWVKVPQIDAGVNTDFVYMYYNNGAAMSTEDAPNVWDSNFISVWHYHQDVDDSTSNTQNGSRSGARGGVGIVADGWEFDGNNDYLTVGSAQIDPARGKSRGVSVDANGIAWIAQHRNNQARITGYDATSVEIATINTRLMDFYTYPAARKPIGVGIGSSGNVWTSNQSSKNVTVVNPATGTVGNYPVGGNPYTYSDFTGSILRTFTAPRGSYSESINACFDGEVVEWNTIFWSGDLPSAETQLVVRVRVAPSAGELSSALWYPDVDDDQDTVEFFPGAPTPGAFPALDVTQSADISSVPVEDPMDSATKYRFIQVEMVLIGDDDAGLKPTLDNFTVARTCPEL